MKRNEQISKQVCSGDLQFFISICISHFFVFPNKVFVLIIVIFSQKVVREVKILRTFSIYAPTPQILRKTVTTFNTVIFSSLNFRISYMQVSFIRITECKLSVLFYMKIMHYMLTKYSIYKRLCEQELLKGGNI